MSEKKRTVTIIETHEVWVLRKPAGDAEPCPECGNGAWMLRPEDAARVHSVPTRAVYRLVEGGHIHFKERLDGTLLVCMASLTGRLGSAPLLASGKE